MANSETVVPAVDPAATPAVQPPDTVPAAQADPLDTALADPEVRASLAVIAAHAPELAAMVTMGNGLLGRSREIMDNVNTRVNYLRDNAVSDPTSERYLELVRAFGDATPTIEAFLNSPILRPEIVAVIGKVGEAALEADRATKGRKLSVGGALHLMRELKDPRIQQTLAFFVTFAKIFGREQAADEIGELPAQAPAGPGAGRKR